MIVVSGVLVVRVVIVVVVQQQKQQQQQQQQQQFAGAAGLPRRPAFEVPPAAMQPKSYETWAKQLAAHLYRTEPMQLWRCKKPKLLGESGESEGDFRARLAMLLREEALFSDRASQDIGTIH